MWSPNLSIHFGVEHFFPGQKSNNLHSPVGKWSLKIIHGLPVEWRAAEGAVKLQIEEHPKFPWMGEREKGRSKAQNNGRKNCIGTHMPSGEERKKKPSEWMRGTIIEVNEDSPEPTARWPLRSWEGRLKCVNYYNFLCGFTQGCPLFRRMAVFWIPPVRFGSKFDTNYRRRGWLSCNGLLTSLYVTGKRKNLQKSGSDIKDTE